MKPTLAALTVAMLLYWSCQNSDTIKKSGTGICECQMTEKEMIDKCPVVADGDSIIICKVGTNTVIGSGKGPMTWQEFLESEYYGAEGTLIDCKTGEELIPGMRSPIVKYRNKGLIIDKRETFDVYDSVKDEWVLQMKLPVWRVRVNAEKNALHISKDSFIFKPPYHGREAFKSVAAEYESEQKRKDHYLVVRTAKRLMLCAMSGDTLSERRLMTIEKDFAAYFTSHADSKKYLDEVITLFNSYKAYLQNGGRREYFDMSIFPRFDYRKKQKT